MMYGFLLGAEGDIMPGALDLVPCVVTSRFVVKGAKQNTSSPPWLVSVIQEASRLIAIRVPGMDWGGRLMAV
jgi:hypothetical protein